METSMNTRPASIPAEVIACTDRMLRSLVNTPFAAHANAEIEFRTANAEAFAEAEALRVADIKANGAVILGMQVTYAELLQLATIRGPKENYAMPEGNIVALLHEQVTTALKGVQNLEFNKLKEAIAEL